MSWFKKLAVVPCVLLSVLASSAAFAERGVVVLEDGNCAIIETAGGFVLVEWYGGSSFSEGSTVVGDLHSYGMKEIFDINSDTEIRVWIEDYWLAEDDAIEQYYETCR